MIPSISQSIYLIVFTHIQFSIIILSNQSTHRIINILSNHWIQLSTHPIICQLIPSYHLYSNQSTHPITDPNNWSIKSYNHFLSLIHTIIINSHSSFHWFNYRMIHLIYSIINFFIQLSISLSSIPYWIHHNQLVSQTIVPLNSPNPSCLIHSHIDKS
jgi:hypothetical protein